MDFSCSVPSQLGTGHDFDRVYEHMWKVLARGNDYLEFDGIVHHCCFEIVIAFIKHSLMRLLTVDRLRAHGGGQFARAHRGQGAQ